MHDVGGLSESVAHLHGVDGSSGGLRGPGGDEGGVEARIRRSFLPRIIYEDADLYYGKPPLCRLFTAAIRVLSIIHGSDPRSIDYPRQ